MLNTHPLEMHFILHTWHHAKPFSVLYKKCYYLCKNLFFTNTASFTNLLKRYLRKTHCIVFNHFTSRETLFLPLLQTHFALYNSVCFAITLHPLQTLHSGKTLCILFSHFTSIINTLHPLQTHCILQNNSACFINIIHPLHTLCSLCSRCSYFTSTWHSSSRNTLLS